MFRWEKMDIKLIFGCDKFEFEIKDGKGPVKALKTKLINLLDKKLIVSFFKVSI